MHTKLENDYSELDQSLWQKERAKGKGVTGPVRDTVHLQKEVLRKNSHQPTESTSAPPTNNPDNKESTDNDNDDNDNDENGGGQGDGETVVGGKKRASNKANEAVASTKRKTPVKDNSKSDLSETPAQYMTCDSPHHLHSVWT